MANKNTNKSKSTKFGTLGNEPDVNGMSPEEFEEYLKTCMNEEKPTDTGSVEENGLHLNKDKQEKEITPEVERAAAEADSAEKTKPDSIKAEPDKKAVPENKEDSELLNKIRSLAKSLYSDSADPISELVKSLEEKNAGSRGMKVEDYRRSEEDRRDAEEFRRLRKRQRDYEDGRQKILDRWLRDTARLKKEVPDFDLDTAMKNDEFRSLVTNGMSIDGAYYAVKYKEMNDRSGARRPIMQNASSRATKSGSGVNDMMNMDDKDFRKKLRNIINGN